MKIIVPVVAFSLLVPAVAGAAPCRGADDPRDFCKEQEIYLMPGAQAVFYAPARAAAAPYAGAGVHFAPLQWSHNSDRFGPSQGALFIQASLLRSQSSTATLALVEAGTTLSFERNASRRWGIPYFGLAAGGLYHTELPNSAYAYPLLGLHAVYHPNVMLDLEGGYLFPFSNLDTLRGPRGDMVMRFSMW